MEMMFWFLPASILYHLTKDDIRYNIDQPSAWFTHKSGRVVVFDRLSVPKRFQDGVSLQQLMFQFPLKDRQEVSPGELREVSGFLG